MRVSLYLVAAAMGLGLALGGCKSAAEERAQVSFHVKAVLMRIDELAEELPSRQESRIRAATGRLVGQLSSLPDRVQKKQPADLERSKAAAKKALDFCLAEVTPMVKPDKLEKMDLGAVNAKLDELRKLVSQVSSDR